MRVVMVNDCAYVGETILKYLPSDVEKQHVKRTRSLWSKTFGLSYKILKAQGDVYHVHYLLQDCYVADRLGKRPLVGHAHGSDLRTVLKHPLWGRIVRHNLRKCAMIFVSTPDLLDTARRSNDHVEYLPNPVDTELFYQKSSARQTGRKRVLIASPSNWTVKGTDIAIRALSRIKNDVDASIVAYGVDFDKTLTLASSLGLNLKILPIVTHERLNGYYWDADVVIDGFRLGAPGMVTLEAIASGRAAMTYVSSQYPEYHDFPLKDIHTEEEIAMALKNTDDALWREQYDYLQAHHKPEDVARQVFTAYDSVLHRSR
jgi:glycosyltransferase involved in cell wall biosynthesis